MQIIVNHLTRMRPGICVAGLDAKRHIRPVLGHQLPRGMLAAEGGVIALGSLVELGAVADVGSAPELEDHEFQEKNLALVRPLAPKEFWSALDGVAKKTLAKLFGPDLYAFGDGCVVDLKKGSASLGCLIPKGKPQLSINHWDSIRMVISDHSDFNNIDLSVTDIRMVEPDHKTPRRDVIDRIAKKINKGVPVILSLGLGRKFQKKNDTEERHYLQVNNVHFEDDPMWS